MTFEDVLQAMRRASGTERDKGARLEALMRRYFLTSAKYRTQVADVWLWSDFPYKAELGGQDTGIDLVIRTIAGEYWSVQCKFYADHTYVSKGDVDSFIATSTRTFCDGEGKKQGFAQMIFISTSLNLSENVNEVFYGQRIPAVKLFPEELDRDTSVDWEKLLYGASGDKAAAGRKFGPRDYQQEAIDKAHAYFQTHDRGKLIMACGTGKTYTALNIIEQETARRGFVLVCVPSIALLNQIMNDWTSDADCPVYPVCVCSDSGASRRRNADESSLADLQFPACTDPDRIVTNVLSCLAKEAESEKDHGLVVVFSTYQSIDIVSAAQARLMRSAVLPEFLPAGRDFTFDYIVCDEAHRTTGATLKGSDDSNFVKIHSNDCVKGKKRLYMTATPRIYAEVSKKKAKESDAVLCSMDDPALYGEEIFRLGFGEAVSRGILSDYKVLVLTIHEDTIPQELRAMVSRNKEISITDAAKLIGCISALSKRVAPGDTHLEADPLPMHKAVAFCSTIAHSQRIMDVFNAFSTKYLESLPAQQRQGLIGVTARHVDGSMPANLREAHLQWLKEAKPEEDKCRILSNVRCLSEGVDVPSLDGIIFLSARNSQVDIVQSVGRIMRKAPGKKYGYVIIPVMVSPDSAPEQILTDNKDFSIIWSVLQALRSHDDRFNAEINKMKFTLDKGELPDDPTVLIGPGLSGGSGGDNDENTPPSGYREISLFDEKLEAVIYARMVEKVGDKHYWEQWAKDIADIARRHVDSIRRRIDEQGQFRRAFQSFVKGLQRNINPNIDDDAAIEMISQHLITRPVFQALFENAPFLAENPISQAMEKLLSLLDKTTYEKEQQQLRKFYDSVRLRCEGIEIAEGRQSVIAELYGTFFKTALSKEVERLGIVFTPVEVVDFINQSVADLLKKEFHRTLSDDDVHIIDPFTGTGTFLVRMIQQGLIRPDALPYKYHAELHANEIVLLAYYIASVNIENAYHDAASGPYAPFPGICLTDTFQLYEKTAAEKAELDNMADPYFAKNSKRADDQRRQPMKVIIGNPPYSVGQRSANDNAQNESYPYLESRIAETYAAGTKATNKNALYDSYIKAFRWASDRLGENGGIIGFVTNAGWLDGQAMDGLRKCFEREFTSIYVYNLRGNQRTKGEVSRKEGGKIFGGGSRTPIAVTILVKNPAAKTEKATIYYRAMDDYLSREDKLAAITKMKSAANSKFMQKVLKPNGHGDWLNQRSNVFSLYPLLGDKNDKKNCNTFFYPIYGRGIATARDPWCYNFSLPTVATNMKTTIDFYNATLQKYLEKPTVKETFEFPFDSKKITWTRATKQNLERKRSYQFNEEKISSSMYRPFCKEWLYYDKYLNEMTYQIPKIFPTKQEQNLLICVPGISGSNVFSVIMTDQIPDLHFNGDTQCFPLYWYEKKVDEGSLFAAQKEQEYIRHDGISDAILTEARRQYDDDNISKEDIFFYVYGFLHSPEYRTQFDADLKKSLPRVPLVDRAEDFAAFRDAGRALAKLHLHYEDQPAPESVVVEKSANDFRVEKMRFAKIGKAKDKSTIVYNGAITIRDIPQDVYDYVLNGRSAVEWIMERYQVTTDKASGIRNDPNDWAREHDDPQYILRLLLSVMTVSLRTMDIVRRLPKIDFLKKG